ncbi:MAG: glutathione S-transferase C-terminal domain-containing protein [Kiloniellaceae bacterium]
MKALIHGRWHGDVTDRAAYEVARAAQPDGLFHHWVNAAPAAAFPAEPGRYHLYVSYACPFAQRTILYRALFGLEEVLPMSVVHPRWRGPDGWTFTPDPCFPEVTRDRANGVDALWQLYVKAAPDFTGKVTVPVLWDTKRETIVSTESADILRMLDLGFARLHAKDLTFYPGRLRDDIDALGGFIRRRVNGGVYKAGFAADQESFDTAVTAFFAALDHLETLLADGRPYLLGRCATEADWLLFPTLVRLDAVYAGALKVNLKRLSDYPRLEAHTQRLYAWPGVAATVKLNHAKRHYYDDLGVTNPSLIPPGPRTPFEDAA